MSGGGPTNGIRNGGPNGPDNGSDCTSIVDRTTLSSPDPDVIQGLQENDFLQLVAESQRGPLYAVTSSGETAGSITSRSLAKILRCIAEGYSYVARVKRVEGGICEVEIRPEDS